MREFTSGNGFYGFFMKKNLDSTHDELSLMKSLILKKIWAIYYFWLHIPHFQGHMIFLNKLVNSAFFSKSSHLDHIDHKTVRKFEIGCLLAA